jgi:hypothetical protein
MTHDCGTCHSILKLLSALQPITEEEKRILLERSRKSLEETTAILRARQPLESSGRCADPDSSQSSHPYKKKSKASASCTTALLINMAMVRDALVCPKKGTLMSEHTSGPWAVYQLADDDKTYGSNAGKFIVTSEDGDLEICGVVSYNNDAHLIAAAPELLEACRTAEANLASLYSGDHIVMKRLRAAVAKATRGIKV